MALARLPIFQAVMMGMKFESSCQKPTTASGHPDNWDCLVPMPQAGVVGVLHVDEGTGLYSDRAE